MILTIFKILSPLFYFLSSILFYVYFHGRDERVLKRARNIDHIAIIVHGSFLAMLTYEISHLPLADAFQALSVFMFIFALLNKIIVREDKDYSLSFLYSGILFILQTISVIFISERAVLPDILKDVAFEVHVLFNLIGYAAFSSAFLGAIMYLILRNEIKRSRNWEAGRLGSSLRPGCGCRRLS